MKRRRQGQRCVVGGCSNSSEKGWTIFTWPEDPTVGKKWAAFVGLTRAHWKRDDYESPVLCCGHFSLDQLLNYNQWINGYASRLRRNNSAIPSIRVPDPSLFQKRKCPVSVPAAEAIAGSDDEAQDNHPMIIFSPSVPSQSTTSKAAHKREIHRLLAQDQTMAVAEVEESNPELDPESSAECITDERSTQTDTQMESTATQTVRASLTKASQTGKASKVSAIQCAIKAPRKHVGIQCEDVGPVEQDTTGPEGDASPDYKPPRKSSPQEPAPVPDEMDRKYIVFHANLLALFALCFSCHKPADAQVREVGSCAIVTQKCAECKATHEWKSQPFVRQMPIGNLLISACLLISGCVISKALRLFEFLNVAMISRGTFYRHQKKYLFPHIFITWKGQQGQLLCEAGELEGGVVLEGDARCDSPGHSAKFGCYTVIEATLNKVLTFSMIQSNEVNSSYHMEMEGLKRVLQTLTDINIKTLVTDRHRSIAKFLREEMPTIRHLYDTWHISKAIQKKLDAAAKKSGCEKIAKWKKAIISHLYWCAGSSEEGDGDMIVAKWKSLTGHIANVHTFDSELFPRCLHGKLRKKPWLKAGTTPYDEVENIVCSPTLLRDIRKLSGGAQTSSLESFHSLLLLFAPKHTGFSYLGMLCRTTLAVMHHNSQGPRPQATTARGEKRFAVEYRKSKKGDPSVRPLKEAPNFDYAKQLVSSLIVRFTTAPKELEGVLDDINVPAYLTDSLCEDRVDKDEAVAGYVSRFGLNHE